MMEKNEFFKNIKVIGFDFDDTLVNEQYYITTKWKAVLKRYSSLSLDLEKTFFKIYQEKGSSYKFHLDDTLHTLRIDIKYRDRILSEFKENKGEERLLAGVIEFLKMVKYNGLRVGIITDGKKSRQKERIKKARIYEIMDFIYYGNGKKEKKPNKKAMNKIFSSFKIKPEQFLYIGNDFEIDIKGMLEIGAKACWVTSEKYPLEAKNFIKVKKLKEAQNIWKKEF